jgi:hypothetical protein
VAGVMTVAVLMATMAVMTPGNANQLWRRG